MRAPVLGEERLEAGHVHVVVPAPALHLPDLREPAEYPLTGHIPALKSNN